MRSTRRRSRSGRDRVDDHHRTDRRRSRATLDLAPDGVTPIGDQLRKAVTVLHGGIDHARAIPRQGRPAAWDRTRPRSRPRVQGTKSEIIRPVLLDPWQAWEVAGSGQLFAEPIPRLRIDRGQKSPHATYPMWTASLRTGWVKHRTAQLQVSASPSFNVTVLELIPATPRRTGNRSFLRVGLPVIEELARRLEATRTTALLEERERWPHT